MVKCPLRYAEIQDYAQAEFINLVSIVEIQIWQSGEGEYCFLTYLVHNYW